jgi:hypothetical protein
MWFGALAKARLSSDEDRTVRIVVACGLFHRMAVLIGATVLASAPVPRPAVAADKLVVWTERFEIKPSAVEVEFSVLNLTPEPARSVVVACTFLDAEGKPLFIQGGIIGEVSSAQTARGLVRVPPDREIRNATCRLSRFSASD